MAVESTWKGPPWSGHSYNITFRFLADSSETTISCPDNKRILEHALSQGVNLKDSCYTGQYCDLGCKAKIISGKAEQDFYSVEGSLLTDDEYNNGYRNLCNCYVYGDTILEIPA
tara:strand:- start:283 stop:624 length:342 start_codon:yes stop_codon:yes gene_type:complete